MDAETKLAYHRLSVLEPAQTLDNVASACHQRGMSRTQFYESVEALQADLGAWLMHYNAVRPHQSYHNRGQDPIDTVNQYLDSVKRETQLYSKPLCGMRKEGRLR